MSSLVTMVTKVKIENLGISCCHKSFTCLKSACSRFCQKKFEIPKLCKIVCHRHECWGNTGKGSIWAEGGGGRFSLFRGVYQLQNYSPEG